MVIRVRVFVLASLTFCRVATVAAQDDGYRVSSVSVGSGESPTSSGLTVTVDLATEKGGFIEVNVQHETGWFMYGRAFKLGKASLVAAASVSVFQEAPAASPYLYFSVPVTEVVGQRVSVSLLEWPGVFLGRAPKDWIDKTDPSGLLVSWFTRGEVSVGGVGLTYGYLKFLNDPTNLLPGVSYTQAVRKDLQVTGSATWNGNSDRAMYYIGAIWKPSR